MCRVCHRCGNFPETCDTNMGHSYDYCVNSKRIPLVSALDSPRPALEFIVSTTIASECAAPLDAFFGGESGSEAKNRSWISRGNQEALKGCQIVPSRSHHVYPLALLSRVLKLESCLAGALRLTCCRPQEEEEEEEVRPGNTRASARWVSAAFRQRCEAK